MHEHLSCFLLLYHEDNKGKKIVLMLINFVLKPEDMLKKQHQQSLGDMIDNCGDCSNSDDLDQENDEDCDEEVDENEEYNDKTEEEMKMVYKIQFQRQNVGSSNGGGTAPSSFVAMVQ